MSTYPKVNGTGDAQLTGRRNRFTVGVGVEYVETWVGLIDAIKDIEETYKLAGWSTESVTDRSPMATLTASIPTNPSGGGGNPNSDFVDTWDVIRATTQKEILYSDHPLIGDLDATNLAELKKYFANPASFDADQGFSALVAGTGPSYDAATYLWALFQNGQKSVEVKQPILKVTRTMSPLYNSSWSLFGIDKIMTTATMIADSGAPNDYIVDLAALEEQITSKVKFDNDGYQKRADVLKLKFGWKKDVSGLQRYGRTRQQISQDYQFGLWDTKALGQPI